MGYEELKNRLAETDREMLKLFRERMIQQASGSDCGKSMDP